MQNSDLKLFNVQAQLDLTVSIHLSARNLEEALQKSKELKDIDFVKIKGEYIDGEIEITGIY